MQLPEARSERQVVAFDTLREDFPGQIHLAWNLPCVVAAPAITDDKTKLKNMGTGRATITNVASRCVTQDLG
ncbi:hypothetical protein AXW37_13945 [Yersinia ruckeri]|nr:hypothetical protein AXW18_13610 [Yersinia ruckeri]OIX34828.1 hypothetical protein AXW20_13615 [Yersinia ruckeri]OIX34838.1 hypothetical protein AXW19_13595 [Yersinia ruckeri]OIX43476.1 hypothetical protein AXW22_13800 [Yersinia ruckeri]OIX45118.1 hypothetical protein AXW21_13635 [Yersinia ruckeri]